MADLDHSSHQAMKLIIWTGAMDILDMVIVIMVMDTIMAMAITMEVIELMVTATVMGFWMGYLTDMVEATVDIMENKLFL